MRRRGTYAVEFALLLPLVMMVFFSLIDLTWALFHLGVLDAAAHRGCRAGSLLDPGEFDQFVDDVAEATQTRMNEVVEEITGQECEACSVTAWTEGSPPVRMLRCQVTRVIEAPVGVVYTDLTLRSQQHALLEWQREAGP